jgi:hypothetical protein
MISFPPRLLQLFCILTFTLFLLRSAPAQAVGGEWNTPYRIYGPTPYARLGNSVSAAGDVNGDGYDDFILGASQYRGGDGMAAVYSGLDGATLHFLHPGISGEAFGLSVSGVGDINLDGYADFAVGSLGTSSQEGGLAIYSGIDATELYHWNGENSWDRFGDSVDCAGDVNGDGVPDIIVGAPQASHGAVSSGGAAYLYSGSDGNLIRVHRTFDFGGDKIDYFGDSVAGVGDVNQDGFDDVIVGSTYFGPGAMGNGNDGAAFVLSGKDGSLLHQIMGSASFVKCGESVSGVGDIDQDGRPDFIIGARNSTIGSLLYCGAAAVYSGATGDVIHLFEGDQWDLNLGSSVAPAGDVDRDGVGDLLIGADHADANGVNEAGEVRIYSGANGSMLHSFSGTKEYGYFGNAVDCAGDLDGDGRLELLAASYNAQVGDDARAGAVMVLDFRPFLTSSQDQISASVASHIDLDLAFPQEAAHYSYMVLASATGTGPFHFGVDIPLSWDRHTNRSFRAIYPAASFIDMHGLLDQDAHAVASFGSPASFYSSAIGSTFYLAAVAYPSGGMPRFSSAVLPLKIVL